ncbi:deformed epidermal autoregulatory factor 1 isoform X2 [Brachionus plicatilis]|uniref:Deformed epidermal autoregulatory factor 1 isoform X2 n=1 Tax=Brachionus plicatilis TaxID=10195 RepID=A0A3M7T5T8_BRAPC|nr:deformed epidermal autoregulatory factor 1 isoform X2 [Brachionus plicatilis]
MVTTFNSNSKLRTKLETLLQLPLNQISYNNLVVDSSVLASAEPDHEHEHEREESAPVDDLDRDDTNSPTVTYSTRKNPTKHFNFDQKILYDDVIQVNCNSVVAELHKKKFGSGGKGRCIRVSAEGADKWMTPIEFETYCGKGNCRDWKRTLKAGGQQILAILDAGILTCHAVSCSCAVCNQNESLVGPIKPFMRYRRRKKDEIVAQNAFKKFLSLKPPTLITDLAFHSPQNSSSPMQKILNNMPKLNNPPLSINTQLNSTDDLVRVKVK